MKSIKKLILALVLIPVALFIVPPAVYCGYILAEYYLFPTDEMKAMQLEDEREYQEYKLKGKRHPTSQQ